MTKVTGLFLTVKSALMGYGLRMIRVSNLKMVSAIDVVGAKFVCVIRARLHWQGWSEGASRRRRQEMPNVAWIEYWQF